jgi:hypothetical protein
MGGGNSWRLSEVIAIVREYDIVCERPSRGSHYKLCKPGHRPYPIPAHNAERTVIKWPYIVGLCRHFAIPQSRFRPN